jgi:hypothetical protein
MGTSRVIAWVLAAALLGGCANRPINEPIACGGGAAARLVMSASPARA